MTKYLTAKILLLGAQDVGKSTLALRLACQNVDGNRVSPTVGVSYVEALQEVGDHVVKLQLWDTAGQERYKSMIPMYYRNTTGALLVYDVTDIESFQAVKNWEAELRTHATRELVIFVIGNKYDSIQTQRSVKQSDARAFANAIGGHFREVSALSNHGVVDMKSELCVQLVFNSQSKRLSLPSFDTYLVDRKNSIQLEKRSSSSTMSSLPISRVCCS